MIKDRADFLTLALLVVGLALIVGAVAGVAVPQFAGPIIIGAMGLPLALGGWKHLSLNGRSAEAQIEHTERTNYALYLANEERQRRLQASQPKPAAAPDLRAEWLEAACRFIVWGKQRGFTIRALARRQETEPDKAVAWDDWKVMVDFLKEAGVLAGTGIGTAWADGWSAERWDAERATLPLPHRAGHPPAVSVPLLEPTTTATTAP